MPRPRRCSAFVSSGVKKCKRAAVQDHVCTQHLNLMPLCACCFEIVVPNTERHLATPCGHALHFECAQKWVGTCESKGRKTTCPTCRAPFSHCMRGLLDTNKEVRRTLAKLSVIDALGVKWHIDSFNTLLDLASSIAQIIKKNPMIDPTLLTSNECYQIITNQGRHWIFPLNVNNPIEILMDFCRQVQDIYKEYQNKVVDSRVREQLARAHLGHGKQLACALF